MNHNDLGNNAPNALKRRQFLGQAGMAAAAMTALQPGVALAQGAKRKIKLGVIGCGGRGAFVTDLFVAHGGYEIHAAADYFQDRLDGFGKKFGVPAERLFATLSGYKKLLESGVEAVAIESPPFFHPEQAAAAVAAGMHVYIAKPVAVDVPGCLSIAESGRAAGAAGKVFIVDFQTRSVKPFQDALAMVHAGALGEMCFGESMYHAGNPFTGPGEALAKNPADPELKLRAWGISRELSGDIITEQNIHTLDVMSWIMNAEPVSACGTAGHKGRKDPGNCRDHFACVFKYPDGVGVTFSSRQFEAHGSKPDGILNRMFGSKGVLETSYGGNVLIRGEQSMKPAATPGIYKDGAANNIATFHESILAGQVENATVAPSVRSNLVTILGRTAADRGGEVSWKEMLQKPEKVEYDLAGLKA